MKIWFTMVLGLLLGAAGMVAIPLSTFIREVEDEAVCNGCGQRESCFAKRPLRKGKSDWLNEWMLITFLKVRGSCAHTSGQKMKEYGIYLLVHMLLYGILIWSRGIDPVSILYGVSAGMLLSLSVVDWNTRFIPMEMSGVILICGLIRLCLDRSNWKEYLIGLFAVSGFLFLTDKLSAPILRKRYDNWDEELGSAVGDGDIKLMAATGLLLGWKLNVLALGIGCVAGSVIHLIRMKFWDGEQELSFGPYLSLGVYITLLCGEELMDWYLNMMGVVPV